VNLHVDIAFSHLRSRRRQTLVSLLGVVLGVAFFLAVSALMRGSERDLIERLVDTAPHITVYDEFRDARPQPARMLFPSGAVQIRGVKPRAERRGIRQYRQKLLTIDAIRGTQAAPVLAAQAIFSFAGRDEAVTLSGIVPARMKNVSQIDDDIVAGSLDAIDAEPERHHHRPRAGQAEPVDGRHGLGRLARRQPAGDEDRRAVRDRQRRLRRARPSRS
jgi:lipoprotein-releasing system permease protein